MLHFAARPFTTHVYTALITITLYTRHLHTSPNVLQGPRGSLVKEFKHLAVDIYMKDKKTIKVEKWFGKKKQIAAVRTVKSHIQNMFKGLTYVRRNKCE